MKTLMLGGRVMAADIAHGLARRHDVTAPSRFLEPDARAFEVICGLDSVGEGPHAAVMSCVTGGPRRREFRSDEHMRKLGQLDGDTDIRLAQIRQEYERRIDATSAALDFSAVTRAGRPERGSCTRAVENEVSPRPAHPTRTAFHQDK